jgi:hypothetical protein
LGLQKIEFKSSIKEKEKNKVGGGWAQDRERRGETGS